ncbi:MAG: hypothetical protein K8F92_16535 [Hyphomicrobium sp.]|uniref:hypothetical protein n=1 Tax=Hyphomicrobium sp. TaxID=82 RepID=UPI0013222CEF|nr:hypothetical protein [Hyphomicrobium sp.]KAB2937053.1 MAG: hypothetical protein F9K20_20620 [Hyphomicrobium sp.]MBZ0211239.1 hypothetical protein [Hyphomicrobium sp.]
MNDDFADRMNAQRAILKQINEVAWPSEELFALSEDAIQRWASVNRLGMDDEVVRLAREAGDALLFLASASQEQVSPEYASHSTNVAAILARLRAKLASP